ncbi:unnamed protein product [Sphagnum jensenii]|uniref:Uncharacterized protein n=1 Tax=Sphagnum jensenii TaxID=128206 RepID=A0ABP1BWK0_9BRYO
MPSTNSQAHGDESATDFPVEDIVQCPLPGYVAPASVAFSPDHKLVSYLYSPDNTLNRKVFAFDPITCQRHLLVNPPGERLRERGFGVTNYEWVKGALGTRLMVALTRRDGSELRLRVASSSSSPFVDPQLSADGYSIAYVCDEERFVLSISVGEPTQIAFATQETGKTHELAEYIAQGKSKLGGEAEEDHVYPFAGHPNVKTGKRELVVVEESNIWVNLHDCFSPLCKGQGRLQGSWIVEQVAGSNEIAGILYFTATYDIPLETHLYSTNLFVEFDWSPLKPKRLTEGCHNVVLDRNIQRFVDIHDSLMSPPRVLLCSLEDGSILASLGSPSQAVVSVYEGPNAQTICNSWMNTVDICMLNIFGAELDNRGSDRHGLMFYRAVKHKLGKADVEAQEAGVQCLISQGLVHPNNVGIYGWSYGGYVAVMALAHCPEMFQCAVASAPVTAWDGYNTHYTEKYMGSPASNSVRFEQSSVMYHVHQITGKLLLVHGMIDENVHFHHTA